jgi:hypothetical protein
MSVRSLPKRGTSINAKNSQSRAKGIKIHPFPFSVPHLEGVSLSVLSYIRLPPLSFVHLSISQEKYILYNLLFVSLPLNNTGLLGYGSTVMSLSGFSSLAR